MDKVLSKNLKCRLHSSKDLNLNVKNSYRFYDYYEIKSDNKKFLITNFKNSPHFKALKSKNFEVYQKYINLSNQKDHSSEKYKYLIKKFDIDLLTNFKIELKQFTYKKKKFYLIIDGLHRVSIYFYITKNNHLPNKYIKIN